MGYGTDLYGTEAPYGFRQAVDPDESFVLALDILEDGHWQVTIQ